MAKRYSPVYRFPAAYTVGFEGEEEDGWIVKDLEDLTYERCKRENRFPCFYPSTVCVVSAGDPEGEIAIMPCGSSSVACRYPFQLSNAFYYRDTSDLLRCRHTLKLIEERQEYVVGVPHIDDDVVDAILFLGNVSGGELRDKLDYTRLTHRPARVVEAPVIEELPISFECRLETIYRFSTHVQALGRVVAIHFDERLTDGSHQLLWRAFPEMVEPIAESEKQIFELDVEARIRKFQAGRDS